MRKQLLSSLLALAAAIPLITCGGRFGVDKEGNRTLVLLHTTDEHSRLLGVGPEVDGYPALGKSQQGKLVGGIARRSSILAAERKRADVLQESSLTFSSGDNLMGTLFQAASTSASPDYRALKALGYDATTLGNHEFDAGPAYLAGALYAAQAQGGLVPVIASNIHFSGEASAPDAALASLYDPTGQDATKPIRPYLVLRATNGLKVGVLGALGAIPAATAPLKAPVSFTVPEDPNQELQARVDDLRNTEKVDLVVLLAHAGTEPDTPELGESYQIARNIAGIDVILSGHTHVTTPPFLVANATTGKNVIVVEPGWNGEAVERLVLKVKQDGTIQMDADQTTLIPVDDRTPADPKMRYLVDEAIQALETPEEWTGAGQSMLERTLSDIEGAPVVNDPKTTGDLFFRKLGATTFELTTRPRKETGMLRLAADSILAEAEASGGPTHVSITSYGNVRGGISLGYSGTIAMSDAFRVYPMGLGPDALGHYTPGFGLVRVAVPAIELRAILEVTATYPFMTRNGADQYLLPSGVSFTFDTSRPVFDPADPGNPAKGRVTRIAFATDHAALDTYDLPIFDFTYSPVGWLNADYPYMPVVLATDVYLALMAQTLGLAYWLPDATAADFAGGTKLVTNIGQVMLFRSTDGSSIKAYEAFAKYVRAQCQANGGVLPSRYDDLSTEGAAPRRAIGTGPGTE
ncbi:bifunctional metallophosphatase/5'-nucleotidase [Geothrix paludis]|uniref:bifunctional metallophosphatase/5'-nucleotidase n=1 Tax=Geothrix paludis TaxID=2922722 RepID=UPI001FAB5F5B|nr:5'-nucleotidase C-terminal domain-containing protein [Geothrix paludis]